MNQTVALTHLAVPVVLHRRRVPDTWTTARYRSTQILEGESQRKEEIRELSADRVINRTIEGPTHLVRNSMLQYMLTK